MAELPKLPRLEGNQGRGTRCNTTSDLRAEVKNMYDSCMCNASGHNYKNNSFTVDLAMVWGRYHVSQNVFLLQIICSSSPF